MQARNILKLILAIIICQMAGIIGSFWVTPNLIWYETLNKPTYAPSGTIIGIVWTILYTLMGISLYLVWQRGLNTPWVKPSLALFTIQLILNTSWNFAFFALQSPFTGLLVIITLWLTIAAATLLFAKTSKPAALLLLPYIIWVTIAATLNYSIYTLNP